MCLHFSVGSRPMVSSLKMNTKSTAVNFLVVVIIGYLSKRVSGEKTDGDSADGPSHEIEVSKLGQLLDSEDDIKKLYEEFESIKGGKRRSWDVASLPENIKKNRYDDLLAFDHSRVVLEKLPDDPNSDYINANYIDGQNSEREYVATQGPLPNTINDFWRMIWQLNVSKIIMLANVVEHGKVKVEKYWPDTNSKMYGKIEVTYMMEYSIPRLEHIVRTFSVKMSGDMKPRIVRQFHFTGWPDLGVPRERLHVLSLIRQARQYDPNSTSPLVVHCSAGIGRTGTIILLDSMIQRAKAEGVVDFSKRLDHMRTLRPDVVEKKEQYVFAYQVVNDFFNVPETQKFLEVVAEDYRRLDNNTDTEDFAPPKGLRQTLYRMKWQNDVMRLLISSLMERSGLMSNIELAK